MKNKFICMIVFFILGVIIGGLIIWLSCCNCCKHTCSHETATLTDSPGVTLIDTITANRYFHFYMNAPVSVDTLKAFAINFDQFNAMNMIANADSTVHGFRIYMGNDSINPVMMVVGTGSPDKVETIYATSAEYSGPCPYNCDGSSPIPR